MLDFKINQKQLYNKVAAGIINKFPQHKKYAVRQAIVEAYLRCGGSFSFIEDKKEVTASLLTKSVGHMWREYVGQPVVLETLAGAFSLKPGDAFGVKPVTGGYNLMLASLASKPMNINTLEGYSLLTLSRAISLREAKYWCKGN